MPSYVVQKVVEALKKIGKSIKNSKVLVLGLAYKKNVDDLRESPSLEILNKLLELGADVEYSDPYFDSIPDTRKYNIKFIHVRAHQHEPYNKNSNKYKLWFGNNMADKLATDASKRSMEVS